MKLFKKARNVILTATLGILTLTACTNNSGDNQSTESSNQNHVRLGVVGENNEQWDFIIEELAKEDIILELVKFSDYVLPNQALAEGDIDLNAFQHKAFLNNEIDSKGYEITAIANTIIAPLGIYSQNLNSISEITEGDKIAIPNDFTNGGRAIKLIEATGLIKVDPSKGYLPSVSDIIDNPLNLEFIEVEAAQTPSLLPDVAAAVINGGHAVDVGLNPTNDSIALEQVNSEGDDNPFINIIVARTEDKDNEIFRRIIEIYHSDEVKNIIEEVYNGVYLVAW